MFDGKMKLPPNFFIIPIILGLLLCIAGCAKAPSPTLPSARFAGNFGGYETCLFNGSSSDTLHIVSSGAAEVSITNLYGLSNAVTGTISNDSCVIQPQVKNNYVIQGLLILSNDTINLSIMATSFGRQDKCTAVLVKQ
jgi:hypothetical protein